MEAAILSFCRLLTAFCNHVESCSKALSDSVKRRPIPLGSAATAFLQSLERRVSTTSSDLNLLHSMAFDTISFEELLGHCNEVYKLNDHYISQVEERMRSFGYISDTGLVDEEDEELGADVKLSCTSKDFQSNTKHSSDDEIFDSISLKNLGLSDASLAALASEDQEFSAGTTLASQEIASYGDSKYIRSSLLNESTADSLNLTGAFNQARIKISVDDYNNLPAFMKNLSSWEELRAAVDKINFYLSGNNASGINYTLDQGVFEMLGLGKKGRTYMLLLLRMNQLSAKTVDGSILFQVCSNSS